MDQSTFIKKLAIWQQEILYLIPINTDYMKKVNVRTWIKSHLVERPKPFVAKAGVKKARYSGGGKVSRKKNV